MVFIESGMFPILWSVNQLWLTTKGI